MGIMGALTPDYDQVAKVTILPRTNGAGGFTLFAPSEERLSSSMYSKRYLKGQLAVALGGRVVEEMVYGKEEITTGASGDLQQVRNIARRMVAQWGFAKESLSAIAWESPDGNGGFGPQGASLNMESQIDKEVKLLVAEAYAHCMKTLTENRQLVEDLTEMLLEKETGLQRAAGARQEIQPGSPRRREHSDASCSPVDGVIERMMCMRIRHSHQDHVPCDRAVPSGSEYDE